jgi:hypothetical protein
MGSNPGRRGGKPGTNRLSYSTAFLRMQLGHTDNATVGLDVFPLLERYILVFWDMTPYSLLGDNERFRGTRLNMEAPYTPKHWKPSTRL